jgi:hypothetical protein
MYGVQSNYVLRTAPSTPHAGIPALSRRQNLCPTLGLCIVARFGFSFPPPMSRNDLMEPEESRNSLRDEMTSSSLPSLISTRGPFDPIFERPAMAILRSSHKVGNTKPQARPFGALLSRIGRHSELVVPKYEDSTKLGIAQVWGPLDCVHLPLSSSLLVFLRGLRLTKTLSGSVRKSMTSPTISAVLIPSKSARTIYTTKL